MKTKSKFSTLCESILKENTDFEKNWYSVSKDHLREEQSQSESAIIDMFVSNDPDDERSIYIMGSLDSKDDSDHSIDKIIVILADPNSDETYFNFKIKEQDIIKKAKEILTPDEDGYAPNLEFTEIDKLTKLYKTSEAYKKALEKAKTLK